ncbi:MAG: tetratricopeptide repeat protein [Bdellovibrionales bacterium]
MRNIAITLFLLSGLFLGSSLQAQNQKTIGDYIKNIGKSKKTKTKLNFNTKSTKVQNEATSRDLSKIKPPSAKILQRQSADKVAKLEAVVDDGIERLFRLIKKYQKSERRGELWLRQGELYVEKARLVEQRIFSDYDRRIQAYEKSKSKRKRRPKLNLKPVKDYYKRATQLYSWFIKDFPKDSRIDQALFFVGYIQFELGQIKQGKSTYTKLIKNYPKSPFVVEANFALAEYHFERDDWKKAYDLYIRVLKSRDAKLYSFAMYKSAWCAYRMGNHKESVKRLARLIVRAKKEQEQGGGARIRLATEGLRDIVMFYSYGGDPAKAESFFRRLGGKSYTQMLENLAYTYSNQGKYRSADSIFKSLIAKDPSAKKSYQYQKQIVLNYSNAGAKQSFKRELVRWLKDFSENSQWYAQNKTDGSVVQDANFDREKILRIHSLKWHQIHENTRSSTSFDEAKFGYNLYFRYFPNGRFAHELYFYFGELMFDKDQFSKAANMYAGSIKTGGKTGKFTRKASLNRLISMEQILPQSPKKKSKSDQPVNMSSETKRFVNAATDHIKLFPNSSESIEVRFRLARVYYEYNRFVEAETLFKAIVRSAPKSKYAEYSANLLLDIYNIKQDFSGMAKVGNELLLTPGFKANKNLTNDIRNIVEKAAFNQGQDYEKKGEYLKAAISFLAFAKKYGKSSLVPVAQYNAAVNYERSGKVLEAIGLYQQAINNTNKLNPEIRKKSILLQANLYEKIGDLEKAAGLFLRYADTYKKDKIRKNLYFNSAVIYRGTNNYSKAIYSYAALAAISRGQEKKNAQFELAKMYQKNKKRRQAIKFYKLFLGGTIYDLNKASEAAFELGQLADSFRNEKDALKWYRKSAFTYKNAKNKYFIAQSRFELSRRKYNEFVGLKIPANPQKQAQVVQKKIQLLDALNKEYGQIISLNSGDQIVKALVWAGRAYRHLGKAILAAPIPKAIQKDQVAEYKSRIGQIANPMIQTANENYETAIRRSYELDVYNSDTKSVYKELTQIYPERYKEDKFVKWLRLDVGGFDVEK